MITIPRAAVHENLPDLGRELRELDLILAPFAEIETGERPPYKVRAIASSDFGVFLLTSVTVGAAIAKGLDWILDAYIKILEIKKRRLELADQGLPDDLLAQIDAHADSRMQTAIEEYVDEYMNAKFGEDLGGRPNELRTAVKYSMSSLAYRVDVGYNFDVRAEEPEQDADDTDAEPTDEAIAATLIVSLSPRLKFVNNTGAPILSLPEGPTTPTDEPPAD